MYKNHILKAAIETTLALPRHTFWATTAVVATLSLDAGLAIIGDGLEVAKMGTPAALAVPGDFVNYNQGSVAAAAMSAFATLTTALGVNNSFNILSGSAANASLSVGFTQVGTFGVVTMNRIKGSDGTSGGAVQYATEVLASSTTHVPLGTANGTNDFQVVKYTISGDISKNFKATFALTGASFSTQGAGAGISMALIVEPPSSLPAAGLVKGLCIGTNIALTASGSQAVADFSVGASCSMNDGTNLYLAYRMTGITANKVGDEVKMTASLASPIETLNPTRVLTVAKAAKGAAVSITPELGGQVYVSAADEAKLFISKDDSTFTGNTAFISDQEVKIGYVKVTPGSSVVDVTGSTVFTIGNTNPTDSTKSDTAVLTISTGQFAASPGGVGATGKAYIDAGSAIDAAFPLTDTKTAKWNLTAAQLKAIANLNTTTYPNGAPIKIKVDRSNTINVEDAVPTADMTVTLASLTTPATETLTGVQLRRIPLDGKVCWVYNVPSPGDGIADLLSVRITNDSKRAGKITGSLYPEAGGTEDFTGENLLTLIAANTSDPRSQVLSIEGTDAVLNAGATIRLSAQDIADIGKIASWAGERKVLKIQSTIPELEVMTLLRYAVDATKQPQSNVSTGVTGSSCIPE